MHRWLQIRIRIGISLKTSMPSRIWIHTTLNRKFNTGQIRYFFFKYYLKLWFWTLISFQNILRMLFGLMNFCRIEYHPAFAFLNPSWLSWVRVSDPDPYPDPDGSALIWVAGSRRAKMTHKNRKKYRIFMFWSAGSSLLKAEGFSCSLGVLYGGLGISK